MVSYQEYINTSTEGELEPVTRSQVEIPNQYDKRDDFNLKNTGRRYDHQFFSMYQYRLASLKSRVDKVAMKKWGNGTQKLDGKTIVRVDKMLNITSNQLCWVSGTVFADMKNKLNILQDVDKGTDDVLPKVPESYINRDDSNEVVMLEDESGRAILQGAEFFKKNILVTGTIVAILGIELQAGMFEVVDIAYPEIAPQKPLTPPSIEGKTKIAFISGLEIAEPENYNIRLEILKQYLQGDFGHESERNSLLKIGHLVIAGNSIKEIEQVDNDDFFSLNNYGTKNVSKFNKETLKMFDQFMNDMVSHMSISIMPGESDPTDICLPQQPLHKSFFTHNKSLVGNNIKTLTNPSWLEIQGIRMLGTSGQNVNDILKYLEADKLEHPAIIPTILESTLKWQNIAPTAPDTLYCYPFDNCDPFTLQDETPRVYFAGNQSKFTCNQVDLGLPNKITTVSIPKFAETGLVVLLDTNTFECETIKIDI